MKSGIQNRILSSLSTKMALKLSSLAILLLLCYSMVSTHLNVEKVLLPTHCARACPPQRDPSRFICARNVVSNQLGMFDSECFFGRYNHCVDVIERKLLKSINETDSH